MFIQMVTGRCNRQDDMHRVVDAWCADMATRDGWLGGTYGFTDDSDFLGIVRFTSQRAYNACCSEASAGMHWAAALECFDASPEIHQGEDVSIMLDGASSEQAGAGFVQVIRGRTSNPEKFRAMATDTAMTSMLHQARPDIIGATMLLEPDGTFTETVCFTSEAEAREGERKEMPAEMAAAMQETMQDMTFSDLHQPWFGSR